MQITNPKATCLKFNADNIDYEALIVNNELVTLTWVGSGKIPDHNIHSHSAALKHVNWYLSKTNQVEQQRVEREQQRKALRFLAFWMAHSDEYMVATTEYGKVYDETIVPAFEDLQANAEQDSHLHSDVLEFTNLTPQQVCIYVWEYH